MLVETVGKNFGKAYKDRFEKNNSLERASRISLPFDSIDTRRNYTALSPNAADIDFYTFRNNLEENTTLVAEILTSQADTVMGLFYCPETPRPEDDDDGDSDDDDGGDGDDDDDDHRRNQCDTDTAVLVAANDDANGLLSALTYQVPVTGTYALGVTFCCDFDFDGVDVGQGAPLDGGRYVLDIFSIDGTLVTLGDDDAAEVALGFDFPFQGNIYNSVFINSNGSLSFGSGDTDFSPSVFEMEGTPPRIAPLWTDLSPNNGGMIVAGNAENGSQTISFMDIPEFFFGGSNNFSVTLSDSGQVDIEYGGLTAPTGIAGVSAGDSSTGTAVDFSSATNWPGAGTTYEEFVFGLSEFDLAGTTITFDP